jgi:glycosyltransferase involved in cell wall biosynthesis
VVTRGSGGVDELVLDGRAGVVVDPTDPSSLAAGALDLYALLAEGAGARARKLAERAFDARMGAARYERLYAALDGDVAPPENA